MKKITALALATICALMMLYGCSSDMGDSAPSTASKTESSHTNNGTVTDTDGFIGNDETTTPSVPAVTSPDASSNMGETIMSEARGMLDDVI